jgi:hypothetical protein
VNPSLLALDVARAAGIAAAATAGAAALDAVRTRRAAVALLVAAAVTPPIAIGYAWAATPSALLHERGVVVLLHGALTALRLAPLALLVVALSPPPALGAEALHCRRLAGAGRAQLAWQWLYDGSGRAWSVAALVAFLLAFGEFELGSRLDAGTWAVRQFDAQAGGQELPVTLRGAAPGMLVQLAALAMAWWLLAGATGAAPAGPPPRGPRRARVVAGWIVAVLAGIALVGYPLAAVGRDALAGLAPLFGDFAIQREVGASLAFAAVGSGCAWFAAAGLLTMTARWPRWARASALAIAAAPGLCGSLALGLALLGAFTAPGWVSLLQTPLPLAIALTLLALPAALAVRRLTEGDAAALHAAWLLEDDPERAPRARALAWQERGARRWWAFAALFLLCYGDLAASAILHPIDMVPVLVMLYNFMHYGESAALSARLIAALVAPVAAIGIGWGAARWWHGRLRLAAGGAHG